jgi:hypothetical protein
MAFHPPFNNFGGAIFHDCQDMQEAVVGYLLEKNGCLPKEFAPFSDCKARVDFPKDWRKFGCKHKSGIYLYGEMDDLLKRADETLLVVDHKTAHPKGDKDPFRSQYEIQTIGYAHITEEINLGHVSSAALFYWDVQHTEVVANPGKFYHDGRLVAPFAPSVHEVEVDYSRLDQVLKEVKKVWMSKTPPEGREGCTDCKRFFALLAIQAEIDETLRQVDQKMLAASGNDRAMLRYVHQRSFHQKWSRIEALRAAHTGTLLFEKDGMAANWENFPAENSRGD